MGKLRPLLRRLGRDAPLDIDGAHVDADQHDQRLGSKRRGVFGMLPGPFTYPAGGAAEGSREIRALKASETMPSRPEEGKRASNCSAIRGIPVCTFMPRGDAE